MESQDKGDFEQYHRWTGRQESSHQQSRFHRQYSTRSHPAETANSAVPRAQAEYSSFLPGFKTLRIESAESRQTPNYENTNPKLRRRSFSPTENQAGSRYRHVHESSADMRPNRGRTWESTTGTSARQYTSEDKHRFKASGTENMIPERSRRSTYTPYRPSNHESTGTRAQSPSIRSISPQELPAQTSWKQDGKLPTLGSRDPYLSPSSSSSSSDDEPLREGRFKPSSEPHIPRVDSLLISDWHGALKQGDYALLAFVASVLKPRKHGPNDDIIRSTPLICDLVNCKDASNILSRLRALKKRNNHRFRSFYILKTLALIKQRDYPSAKRACHTLIEQGQELPNPAGLTTLASGYWLMRTILRALRDKEHTADDNVSWYAEQVSSIHKQMKENGIEWTDHFWIDDCLTDKPKRPVAIERTESTLDSSSDTSAGSKSSWSIIDDTGFPISVEHHKKRIKSSNKPRIQNLRKQLDQGKIKAEDVRYVRARCDVEVRRGGGYNSNLNDDYLQLKRGDIIKVTKGDRIFDWEGSLRGVTGLFDPDNVEPFLAGRVKAKYTFVPASVGNLLVYKSGEFITVLEPIDGDWFKGSSGGRVGVFQMKWVEPFDHDYSEFLARNPDEEEGNVIIWVG
ncbi:hypothetical protein TWF694_002020 [Orbilia ellipsospora]|uniref:SH3 domain-containing protein n=1 Tax=Orbilia ellipsospora TaxID=2528407 RepID=A0AAV9X6X5_9PEZI